MNNTLQLPRVSVAIFMTLLLVGIMLGGSVDFSSAQNHSIVSGIIVADTTWTRANSPYIFAGPVDVAINATLTVEAGATVNLENYYLQVNGTLRARGTEADKVQFNGGK